MPILNTQPAEKRAPKADRLEVHSVFKTIQGEGPFSGHPAIFLRLAGCNLQCPLCDTDYTSTRRSHTALETVDRVVSLITREELVVITGGEPFRQDLSELTRLLAHTDLQVQIETNGTLAPTVGVGLPRLTIVVSPKAPKLNPALALAASAFKYVIDRARVDPEDGLPLSVLGNDHRAARPPEGWKGPVYIQPIDVKDPEENRLHLAECVSISQRFGYILGLQMHKYCDLP